MAGFLRAADHMQRVNAADHDAAYNLKMLLGECLAVALYRNTRYRQVAQRYIDLEDPAADDPVLSFVVVRAFSKLAELAPALIDWGALLRVTASLDAQPPFGNRKQVVAMLVARIAAKVRGTDLGATCLFERSVREELRHGSRRFAAYRLVRSRRRRCSTSPSLRRCIRIEPRR